MKLTNPEKAIIESSKLSGYCLNPEHPTGQHKAKVFRAVLGLQKEDEEELRQALRQTAYSGNAVFEKENQYGKKYRIDFTMTRNHQKAIIRSIWIVSFRERVPRLVTCYILKEEKNL